MSLFSFNKLLTSASIFLFSIGTVSGAPSSAQGRTDCVDGTRPSQDGCLKAAEKYELTIYEMGLCTSDPLVLSSGSRVFNKSEASCVATFANNSGKRANIAGSQSVDLGQGTKPPSNTYTHAYIVLSKNFTLKGTHSYGGVTHYSIQGTDEYGTLGFSSTNSSSYEEFTEMVDDVSGSEQWGPYMSATEHPDGGSVTALLTGSGYSVSDNGADAASSKSAVDKLIGVFAASGSGITISDNDTGLEVTLDSSKGMSVWFEGESEDTAGLGFGSAPFRPAFTVIN